MNKIGQGKQIAIITGASSGVGLEFAKQIDKKYKLDEIWLIARREVRLRSLERSLTTKCKVIPADVNSESFEREFEALLWQENPTVRLLVNSAGIGIYGDFMKTPLKDNRSMIDLNIRALTTINQLTIPYMNKGSKILNIASVASFMPQDGFAVYAASKSYVLSFSRALNSELIDEGITVTAVCPNPMNTEFFKEKITGIKSLAVEDVEKVVAKALQQAEKNKDISLQSFLAHVIRFISRILPHRWALFVERKFNGS